MHSDHTLGLSDLIITPWIMGKTQTLKLHGPKELNLMAQNIIDAYAFDIDYRINGTQPQNSSGYKYDFFEIHDGYIFENDDIKLEAFKNSHGDLEKSFGFVVTTTDLKIVFSGDTAPSNKLLNKSKDADILVHEVFSEAGFLKKTPDWQIYHAAHHTSPKQLGSIAKKIKPKKLVLSHILYWGSSEDDIKNEVAKYYDGEILVASDLMQIY
jgi:ribonuclease BN (tRNA processing enzyme)